MTKHYLAVFRHFAMRRLTLLALASLTLVVVFGSHLPLADAFSWAPKIKMGANGFYTVLFDASTRARPTDGLGYVLGEGGNGTTNLLLSTSAQPGLDINVNDANPGQSGGMRNKLAFGQDGAGYMVWRYHPAGYQSWFRQLQAGTSLSLISGFDIGGLYRAAGGAKELDLPDVAVSPLTGKVYVAGSVVTGPQHLGFGELNPATKTFVNITDNLPNSSGGEIQPRICVDTSQGRDDIHIIGWFGANLYGIDRINGVWSPSPPLTSSGIGGGPLQYQLGRTVPSIACDSDGYAYAAFDSINYTHDSNGNGANSTGLARYTPGQGWTLVNRYPGKYFFSGLDIGGYDIYGPPYTTNGCGIQLVAGSAVTVTPDHKVWVSSGMNCGAYAGQSVASFSNRGLTLETIEAGIPYGNTSNKVDISYAGISARLYISSVFKSPSPNITWLSYATYVVGPSNLVATAISFKQINLSWVFSSPGNYTNVQLERYNSATTNWDTIAQLPSSQTTYSDSNLPAPGTAYAYRVKGYNTTASTPYSTQAIATTVSPATLHFDIAPNQIEPAPTTFGVAPKLSVLDPFGNVVTNYTGSVTLAITAGPAGYTFGGTKTIAVVNGIADFTSAGLTLDLIGSYTMQATAPGLPSGTLSGISYPVVRANLVFTSSPSPNPLANGQFSVTVQVQRPSNNSVLNNYNYNGAAIALSIKAGNGASGAKLNGSNSVTVAIPNSGVINVSNLTIDQFGGNYQLLVIGSDTAFTSAYSNVFNVLATPSFAATPTNPSPVIANSSFTVVVTVKDAGGNTLITYNGPVTLSANSGTLLGIPTVNAVNGVATFTNLAFTTNGTYTLQAKLPLGNAVTSNNITVNAATGCQSLLVNNTNNDDGCNNVTLTGALGRATSGQVIRFAPGVQGTTITLGAGPIVVPNGVSLEGGCDNNGPRVTITVTGNSTFQVGPNSTVWGIGLNNLRLLLPSGAKGNKFSCFVATP